MSEFIVRPIAPGITAAVRATLLAPDYGHPVHRELARGTGPCRECLAEFTVQSEDRLLFTYNPFRESGSTPQPGPVFIHATSCVPFAASGFPHGLMRLPLLAEAYRDDGSRSAPRALEAGAEAGILAEMLNDGPVKRLHLRHRDAGCFIARVDRAGE